MIRIACLAAAFCLAGFVPAPAAMAQTGEFETPVTGEFIPGEINFTGGLGRVYEYRWDLAVIEGRIALCGVGYLRDARLRSTINDMLEGATLSSDTHEVAVDARFFSRARSAGRLDQSTATCRLTNLPVPRSGAIFFSPSRGTFRN